MVRLEVPVVVADDVVEGGKEQPTHEKTQSK